ncbi:MAG: hypothetical protein EB075_11560, partial [Bacteroidetes bacterium]|nr:hypothetical protein [Bacteroidota bacterium]
MRTGICQYFMHRRVFAAPQELLDTQMRFAPAEERDLDALLCTWVPSGALWATMYKISPTETCFYPHDGAGRVFMATPNASLHRDCPMGTLLLVQLVVDEVHGQMQPRVLVFDVVQVGMHWDVRKRAARERYALLRSTVQPWLCGPSFCL